jgi:hypothetical protein
MSKQDSSHSSRDSRSRDGSKHEKDHTRAHESGNGKKKGHGKHH